MKRSEFTRKSEITLWVLRAIDAILLLVPLIVYFFIGVCGDALVYEKAALVGSVSVALMLCIFNILAKKRFRSLIWIVVLGLYVAVDNLIPLIIIIAVSTIIDEFILEPLIERQKMDVVSNKTLDRRL